MRRSIIDSQHSEEEEGINLTPMLDVVFIMLIFFIVTASFIKEAGIEIERPDAKTAVNKKNANIIVAISANNEIWMDRKRIKPQGVRGQIERMHAENPEGSLIIQVDKDSYSKTLMIVMDAAREAKVAVAIAANN
ncbi:MAG: biopolymer transporter ExbD [Chromatiales bacterium]|jgi:biopolymer transport protein ExbD|nr:biopolymer transporter ExbD [Chromatiales bacterium]